MKNTLAFTFVEIIVTVSILLLVSSTGVYYFFDFVGSQQIKSEVGFIQSEIKSLNRELRKDNIFDYELNFDTMSGYLVFSSSTNSSLSDTPVIINSHTQDSVHLSISGSTGSVLWNIKAYEDHKLVDNRVLPADEDYEFNFGTSQYYSFISELDGIKNNTIKSYHYAIENIQDDEGKTSLEEINSQKDKSGITYQEIKVKNNSKNFEITGDQSNSLNEVYLFFEKQSQPNVLLINESIGK